MLRAAVSRGRSVVGARAWAQGGLPQQQLRYRSDTPERMDLEGGLTLQEARTWDEGVASKFKKTPLSEIFAGAYTGVCSQQHVPSYLKSADDLKAKGVDKIICVAVNDPYVMNSWAQQLKAKEKLEFYGDFDGSFHKHLGLECDLTGAMLGPRSQRWSAYVVNGMIKVLNVEAQPSDFKVSGGDRILTSIHYTT